MEQPERVDSEVPDTSDLLDALLQRAWLMFLDERESPKRSRIDRAAECQTIKVICLVDTGRALFFGRTARPPLDSAANHEYRMAS